MSRIDPSHFPSHTTVDELVAAYLASLSKTKRDKALISSAMMENIVRVLLDPSSTQVGTAQFRFWAKRQFNLKHENDGTWSVTQEGRTVACKESIYSVLVFCHSAANHGGRDKTAAMVRGPLPLVLLGPRSITTANRCALDLAPSPLCKGPVPSPSRFCEGLPDLRRQASEDQDARVGA